MKYAHSICINRDGTDDMILTLRTLLSPELKNKNSSAKNLLERVTTHLEYSRGFLFGRQVVEKKRGLKGKAVEVDVETVMLEVAEQHKSVLQNERNLTLDQLSVHLLQATLLFRKCKDFYNVVGRAESSKRRKLGSNTQILEGAGDDHVGAKMEEGWEPSHIRDPDEAGEGHAIEEERFVEDVTSFIIELLRIIGGAHVGVEILERLSVHADLFTGTCYSRHCEHILSAAALALASRDRSPAKSVQEQKSRALSKAYFEKIAKIVIENGSSVTGNTKIRSSALLWLLQSFLENIKSAPSDSVLSNNLGWIFLNLEKLPSTSVSVSPSVEGPHQLHVLLTPELARSVFNEVGISSVQNSLQQMNQSLSSAFDLPNILCGTSIISMKETNGDGKLREKLEFYFDSLTCSRHDDSSNRGSFTLTEENKARSLGGEETVDGVVHADVFVDTSFVLPDDESQWRFYLLQYSKTYANDWTLTDESILVNIGASIKSIGGEISRLLAQAVSLIKRVSNPSFTALLRAFAIIPSSLVQSFLLRAFLPAILYLSLELYIQEEWISLFYSTLEYALDESLELLKILKKTPTDPQVGSAYRVTVDIVVELFTGSTNEQFRAHAFGTLLYFIPLFSGRFDFLI